MLHASVKFCEKLVSNKFVKDVHDDRQRIMLPLDHFVELSYITDPMNTTIFPGDNEGGACPFAFLLLLEDPLTYEVVQLFFEVAG